MKRSAANARHAVRDVNAGQVGAAPKCIIANARHAVLDHNGLDLRAAAIPRHIAPKVICHCPAAGDGQHTVVCQHPIHICPACAAGHLCCTVGRRGTEDAIRLLNRKNFDGFLRRFFGGLFRRFFRWFLCRFFGGFFCGHFVLIRPVHGHCDDDIAEMIHFECDGVPGDIDLVQQDGLLIVSVNHRKVGSVLVGGGICGLLSDAVQRHLNCAPLRLVFRAVPGQLDVKARQKKEFGIKRVFRLLLCILLFKAAD